MDGRMTPILADIRPELLATHDDDTQPGRLRLLLRDKTVVTERQGASTYDATTLCRRAVAGTIYYRDVVRHRDSITFHSRCYAILTGLKSDSCEF